jgi:hypothetical protein
LRAAGRSGNVWSAFCSLLISAGESPVRVQQQAGHASVEMTVSVYGSWFPVSAPSAMDRLAAGLGAGAPVAESTLPVASHSRIYCGIHFRTAMHAGFMTGGLVAHLVDRTLLQPVRH